MLQFEDHALADDGVDAGIDLDNLCRRRRR